MLLCYFEESAVVVQTAPFGIPVTAFWMYVCALLLLVVGMIRILKDLSQQDGIDQIMPFGQLFFAIPMAVFGSEHFTATADIAGLVPRWIPAHLFWVYAVGLGFLCAGLSIAILVQARLAASLVAMTMFVFACTMGIPGLISNPHNRFAWVLALREPSFGCGALAFAISAWSTRPRFASPARRMSPWIALPRLFVGATSVFYGVEHLLHPEHVPGVPLERISPEWIPGRLFLSYFVGVVLILAGASLLVNRKARAAATILGLTIFLTVLWIYLPMLLAAPKDVESLNYIFDTLLFCGAILLLAGALEKDPALTRS